MPGIEVCEVCGVPLMISREFTWESNGIIGMTASPVGRAVFFESEIIDNLFRGIEELFGRSIWHIVVESRRRDVKKYMEKIFTEQKKLWKQTRKYLRSQQTQDMRKADMIRVNDVGRLYGYGDISLSDRWGRDDYPWRTQFIRDPYSMYLYPAELLGSVEALEQMDMWVEYKEIGDNVYEVTTFHGRHPIALKQRLKQRRYVFKPGEMQYSRCTGCGVPQEIAACRWDVDAGKIIDSATGRRMAIFGPWAVDAVIDDLKKELGESIQDAVIEVLRRYLKVAMIDESWRRDAITFNRMIGMRGLGNLVDFKGDQEFLTMTIQNSCMPLILVGAIQGLFELAMGVETSSCEWEQADDGDLTVAVRSK